MKTKMREKVRPKMGKIDIDYQKLHDAFFKWQIKPKLTIHGDLYYEVQNLLLCPKAGTRAAFIHVFCLVNVRLVVFSFYGQ